MKAKLNHSDLDDRKYITKVLVMAGIFSFGTAVNISYPALAHIFSKLA